MLMMVPIASPEFTAQQEALLLFQTMPSSMMDIKSPHGIHRMMVQEHLILPHTPSPHPVQDSTLNGVMHTQFATMATTLPAVQI